MQHYTGDRQARNATGLILTCQLHWLSWCMFHCSHLSVCKSDMLSSLSEYLSIYQTVFEHTMSLLEPSCMSYHLVYLLPCFIYASAVLWVPTMWNRITYFTLCRCMTTMPGGNCHSLFVGGFFAPHSLLTQHTGESLQAKFRASRILGLIISWVEWGAFSCTAESLRVVLYFCTERWWFTFLCQGKEEA